MTHRSTTRRSRRNRTRNLDLDRITQLEDRRLLASFLVTSAGDTGPGTLRQAILSANSTPGADVIIFNVPLAGDVDIALDTPLPSVTEAVRIEGYTQPGSQINATVDNDDRPPNGDIAVPLVHLDGLAAGPLADGLTIAAPNVEVEGLVITGFGGTGIVLTPQAIGCLVWGNFVGTVPQSIPEYNGSLIDPTTNPDANGQGIVIQGSNNAIGGTTPVMRNLIQGNLGAGLRIEGRGGTGNLVEANFILDNGSDGVLITTSNNFIGEPIGPGAGGGGNVISGNQRGVHITSEGMLPGSVPSRNIIWNNEIGTNIRLPNYVNGSPLRGMSSRGNTLEGVWIEDAPWNIVGGLVTNSGNVIAANGGDGIRISGTNSERNQILGNKIGFNSDDSTVAIMPNRDGVDITSPRNQIGGTSDAARNTISCNTLHGIEITWADAIENLVQGNYIGTVRGGDDFGNAFDGVHIQDTTANTIGGSVAHAGNLISGNNNGVVVTFSTPPDPIMTAGNLIQGNRIGTEADGVTDLGNAVDGIRLDNAPNNTIGGTGDLAGNVLSGNNWGLTIQGTGAVNNLVLGNAIGTDTTGTIDVGNAREGVRLLAGTANNTIGGSVAGAGNVVGGNLSGILIDGDGTTANLVQGNLIGLDRSGQSAIGNVLDGVIITDGASGNTIGGETAAAGNQIANDLRNGIRVESGTGNALRSNRIFQDGRLGIDLVGGVENSFGVTANGPQPRSGPNALVNTPVLVAAVTDSQHVSLQATYLGLPDTSYSLQFFSSPQAHASGYGEGQTLLATQTILTDAIGQATIAVTLDAVIAPGQVFAATATDPAGDTSEFSNALATVTSSLAFSGTTYLVGIGNGLATITVTRTGGINTRSSVSCATAPGTATPGVDYVDVATTLVFIPGDVSRTFTVPILPRTGAQPDRTILLSLSNPTDAASLSTPSTATLTIRDNRVHFKAATVTVAETTPTLVLTVVRDGDTGAASVDYATSGGTAKPNVNYRPIAGTIVFAPGQLSATITLPILHDPAMGGDKTVQVVLSNPVNLALSAPNPETITIRDVDQPGIVQFAVPSLSVSEQAGSITVPLVRTGGIDLAATVMFGTVDATAHAGLDYTSTWTVVTFAPGQTSQTVTVPILNRQLTTGSAVFVAALGPMKNAMVPAPTAIPVVIRYDAPDRVPPTVTDLWTIADARGITAIVIAFSEPLDPARAVQPFNYDNAVLSPGRDGVFGTTDDLPVRLGNVVYDPTSHAVALIPITPLAFNTFYRLRINRVLAPVVGSGAADVAGNLLDGDGDGKPGGMYQTDIAFGTRLTYREADGDQVSLQFDGGGAMLMLLNPSSEARSVRLLGTVPNASVLSGSVKRTRASDGLARIPQIQSGPGVKIRLASPPFVLGPSGVAGTAVAAAVAVSPIARRSVTWR